jgi:hypothetical protein
MISDFQIPEPFQFNPLKHHLSQIREFISARLAEGNKTEIKDLVRELKHIGTSVMDVYTGSLRMDEIYGEVAEFLKKEKLSDIKRFSAWTGTNFNDFRLIILSDSSQWMLKFHDDEKRFVHLFPARQSPHSFRVKANTLKSAIIYYLIIGKDFITREDLNSGRSLLGLSPVKNTAETEAITEMIEILRKE